MTERGWRISVLERGVPSPWDVRPLDSVCLSSPKQAVTSSEPNFWPHSLQIHCNGLSPKTVTLQYPMSNNIDRCNSWKWKFWLRHHSTPASHWFDSRILQIKGKCQITISLGSPNCLILSKVSGYYLPTRFGSDMCNICFTIESQYKQ